MYYPIALLCLIAAVLAAPAPAPEPSPSPVANPQQLFQWPWGSPIYQPYYSIVAPYARSLVALQPVPVAYVPSQEIGDLQQSTDSTDGKASSLSESRRKRDLKTQPEELSVAESPVQRAKRQSSYVNMPIQWMPFYSPVPWSVAWSSHASPVSSYAWSVGTAAI